jgi:CBS-domain-containing membrane protein
MKTFTNRNVLSRFGRWAMRVSDLMTRDPLSIRGEATIREAIAFLATKCLTTAPVINEAGRPIGVLCLGNLVKTLQSHDIDESTFFDMQVRDFATPLGYFVKADTPLYIVVGDLLDCRTPQMYVADDDGVLVGVLSAADLLREVHRTAEELNGAQCTVA